MCVCGWSVVSTRIEKGGEFGERVKVRSVRLERIEAGRQAEILKHPTSM